MCKFSRKQRFDVYNCEFSHISTNFYLISSAELYCTYSEVGRSNGPKIDASCTPNGKKLFSKGSELYDKGEYEKAFTHFNKALELFRAEKDNQGQANALLEMGNISGVLKDFERAKQYYEGSLILYQRTQDLLGEGYALTGLALISEKHEDYEELLDYYKRSFQKFEELGDQKRADTVLNLMAHNLLELGNKYADFKVLKRAERYYKDSLELYQITEDVHGQGQALKGMGAVSENYGNQEKALDYYKKALDRFREVGDHRETKLVSDLMAKIWES